MTSLRLHPVPKRDLHFDFSGVDMLRWHPRGPQACHFFNVQSLMFPKGERFFIRSVRHYRDQITDPVLQQQVAGFIGQEAMHGREHESYNAALGKAGYPVQWMERWVSALLWFADKTMFPKDQLAMTVSLEHLTSIAAEDVLSDERLLEGAHPEMARLWRWHAMEETEHKAVAFDVYRAVAGEGFAAWLRRCLIMLSVSFSMQFTIAVFMLVVSIRTGTFFNLRAWGSLFWATWVVPGAMRKQFFRYWLFFKPSFHPWQSDNFDQVLRWQAAYTPKQT